MAKKYNQEQIFEILEKLPKEAREVLFSEKTADDIDNVCKKYRVGLEKVSDVAKFAGQVLLGILPLEEFPEILEKEAGLRKNTAKNVAQEIRLSIFSQVESVAKKTLIETGEMPAVKESRKPSAEDVYREQI